MSVGGVLFHKVSTDEWVGFPDRDPADEDGFRVWGLPDGSTRDFMYSDVPGNSWNPQKLGRAEAWVQENLLDVRIPLTDPSLADDPHGLNGTDPARPDFFWEGGDLVARPVIIENVRFENGRLDFDINTVSR